MVSNDITRACVDDVAQAAVEVGVEEVFEADLAEEVETLVVGVVLVGKV